MAVQRNKLEEYLFDKGYSIDDSGKVYNPSGKALALHIHDGYPCVSTRYVNEDGHRCFRHVKISRLQAFKKYGKLIFDTRFVIRHLDGNKLNNSVSNIAIGTMQDNIYDIPRSFRQQKSIPGAKKVNKYSKDFVSKLRKEHYYGKTYSQLMKEYRLPKSTISYIMHHSYITH